MEKVKGKFRIVATARELRNSDEFSARASVTWDDDTSTFVWYCDSSRAHATSAEAEADVMEIAEEWIDSGAPGRQNIGRAIK